MSRAVASGLLALAALLAWSNTFSAPFVFDDRPAILANPTLESFTAALSPPRDGGTVAGRPLINLSLALNRAISGTAVGSYHAVNLLIHLLTGLTLFGLLRRTLLAGRCERQRVDAIAFPAALLWLLHPLQTAAVTAIIQRAESLMALCFLTTLYAFARANLCHLMDDKLSPRAGHGWLGLSVVACLAGMACKEVMVVAPLVVLLYDRTFVAGSFAAALRSRARYYAALASTWLLLAWLVVTNAARAGTAGFGTKIAWTDYALTQCSAVARYLKLSLWPYPLVFDYGTAVETSLVAVWPQALLVLALAAATIVALRRRPALGFLGACFFLVLAPSSSVVPIATQTIAEHRMYLPLAALATAAALTLHRWLDRRTLVAALPLAFVFGAMTFARNRDYRDALTLWDDTVAKRPENPRAHNNLGIELSRARRPAEAIAHFEIALRTHADDAELHNNLGNALVATDRGSEALPHFEASVRLNPGSFAARLNLAHALLGAARAAEAIGHFAAAEKLAPLDAHALSSLGVALVQAGRIPAAIERYQQAVRVDPGHARAHYNLGLAFARTNQLPEAMEALRAAVRLDPRNVAARANLGNVLLLRGRSAEAVVEYEAALQLKPDDPQLRSNLARARAMARP